MAAATVGPGKEARAERNNCSASPYEARWEALKAWERNSSHPGIPSLAKAVTDTLMHTKQIVSMSRILVYSFVNPGGVCEPPAPGIQLLRVVFTIRRGRFNGPKLI